MAGTTAVVSSGIHPAEFLQRHTVFLRRARDASHQSLFFLGLLEKTDSEPVNRAIECYRQFALYQVKSLIRGVHLPDSYKEAETGLQDGSLRPMPRQAEAMGRAIEIFRSWCAIFETVADHNEISPVALRLKLLDFLKLSQETKRRARLEQHWLPALLSYLRKNLTVIWVIALIAVSVLKVEVISALLGNEGFRITFPLVFLLSPLLLVWGLIVSFRRIRGVAPAWDLAGPAFRSFRYQALEPGRLITRWPDDKQLSHAIFTGQLATLFIYAMAWSLSFGFLYFLFKINVASGSTVTTFLVLSHFYFLLIIARCLDFWDFLDPRPIRFIGLFGGAALLVLLLAGIARGPLIGLILILAIAYWALSKQRGMFRTSVALGLLLVAALLYRGKLTLEKEVWKNTDREWNRIGRKEWPWPSPPGEPKPVVIMAASGGGSRAAVYTGLALRELQMADETAEISEQLQAISSVSGGSLASAAYISRLYQTPYHLDTEDRRKRRGMVLGDLISSLATDFILPTLRGALCPGQTRASAIEEEWRQGEVGLDNLSLGDLAKRWIQLRRSQDRPKVPPFPIPLFNSSTLDGHNVVLSPLSKELYTRQGLDDEASDPARNAYDEMKMKDPDRPTWVYYRDGIYGFEDLLPNFNPTLSSAVRASANFPFGFPLVKVRTSQGLFFSPIRKDRQKGKKPEVALTDGGTLSNSGMWSLFNLLMHRDNLTELRKRGVLLIIVEASRMPVYRRSGQSFNSLLGTIEDKGPLGQRLHREMFDILERAYGDRIAIVQIDMMPRETYNVLTTWALDGNSLRNLRASFNERWTDELPHLVNSWKGLKNLPAAAGRPCDPQAPAVGPYIAKRRPPLY